jgi:DNA-binding NtrC family response regulator
VPQLPRILVVDGDALVRGVVSEALQYYGYAPVGAANVAAAVGLAGDGIHVVLADLWSGGLELRPLAGRLGVPLVLMSGDATALAEAAGDEVPTLVKPFSLGELARVVAEALETSARSD